MQTKSLIGKQIASIGPFKVYFTDKKGKRIDIGKLNLDYESVKSLAEEMRSMVYRFTGYKDPNKTDAN